MDKADFYRNTRSDRTGPLDGVRVLDTTTAWAGPMAGCLLADMGADVIRIVPPGDEGLRWPPFIADSTRSFSEETVNRNKRSVTIDLRQPAGAELFLDLVRTADIVVENFKPGTLQRWGVGYADCAAVKADIVYVSISGWGQFGPRHERPGYDPAALAFSGWMALNGNADGPPVKAPTFLADDLAGLHAAFSALAALRHRDVTGEGQHVDIALLDSMLFQSNGMLSMGASDLPLRRWGPEIAVSVPTSTYACSDGFAFIALILDTHWRALTDALGMPEMARAPGFATNIERLDRRDEINDLVARWCASRTVAQVIAVLDEAGIVASPVQDYATAAKDPHVHERDMLQHTTLSDGTVAPLTGPAAKFSRTPTSIRRSAPLPGAHTSELLDELGIDDQRRAQLRDTGVIG